MKKYKIITLCGSTKFKSRFYDVATALTLKGNIILMPHCYSHTDNEIFDNDTKDMIVDMHYQMIDMSDEIFVINVDGYIGESTANEIKYAKQHDKHVNYLYINV